LWGLGVAVDRSGIAGSFQWHVVFLLGSCFTAPLGLHICLDLTGRTRPWRGVLVGAYAAAALLYLSSWTRVYYEWHTEWNFTAMTVLGIVFAAALSVTARQGLTRRHGPERRAYRLLFLSGGLAVLAGLSDFIPRGDGATP